MYFSHIIRVTETRKLSWLRCDMEGAKQLKHINWNI